MVLEIPPLPPLLELEPPFVEIVLVATVKPPRLPLLSADCKLFYWAIAAAEPGAFVVLISAFTIIEP